MNWSMATTINHTKKYPAGTIPKMYSSKGGTNAADK